MSGPRVRFAPSPTGSLHLGNARTALFNWLVARRDGGTFVLRIEDTDVVREQEGSESSILEDLRWLGLDWDEGPEAGGAFGPYRQSERTRWYREAADRLLERRAAFLCFCEAAGGGEPGRGLAHHAPGSPAGHRDPCRALDPVEASARLAAGAPAAVRFRVPAQDAFGAFSVRFDDRLRGGIDVPLAQVADGVLLRHDGRPTYNFGVVVDDIAMKIDLVLRGDDHLSNTPAQVLLYQAMDARLPQFAHVPMVLGTDGERLSKRHGATSVAAWRERGVPAEALVNALALLGWAPSGDRTIVEPEEILREFSLDRVGKSAAVFDPVKLLWIAAQHIHAMPQERLSAAVRIALVASKRLEPFQAERAPKWIDAIASFLRPSLSSFDQVDLQSEPLFHAGGALDDEAAAAVRAPGAVGVLEALRARLSGPPPEDTAAWSALRTALQTETGAKGRLLFQPLRVALTGRGHGRELDHLVPLIVAGHRALPEAVPGLEARVRRTLEGLA
jgi:nondiscriminating glutamyl-tRNA synthetase